MSGAALLKSGTIGNIFDTPYWDVGCCNCAWVCGCVTCGFCCDCVGVTGCCCWVRMLGFLSGTAGLSSDEQRFGTGGLGLPCD